jgi:hypothetical protein
MRQGHRAPLRPSRVSRQVRPNNLFVQVRRHHAWTGIYPYRCPNAGTHKAVWKARRGSLSHAGAARIDQQDAAVTPASCVFDKPTDRFEYFQH